MESLVVKTKRTSEGNIKATVKCCYCNKVNNHCNSKSIVPWRGCDACASGKDYKVAF